MDPCVGPHSSAALSHGRAPWLVLGLWVPRVWRRVSDIGVRARFHSQPPTPALQPLPRPTSNHDRPVQGIVVGVVWCREAEGAPGSGCVGVLFGFHSLFATTPVPLGGALPSTGPVEEGSCQGGWRSPARGSPSRLQSRRGAPFRMPSMAHPGGTPDPRPRTQLRSQSPRRRRGCDLG